MHSSKLTAEEEFIKTKYELLKTLKKELKQLTIKQKQEQSNLNDNGPASAKQKKVIIQGSKPPSHPQEFTFGATYKAPVVDSKKAAANTAAAKLLLKSGAIKVKVENKTTFKRSSNLKRKNTDGETPERRSKLQVFSAGSETTEEEIEAKEEKKAKSFRSERREKFRRSGFGKEKKAPRRGNTLYVCGFAVNEAMLRENFSRFGKIIDVNMEANKNSGFVSLDSLDGADRAAKELNETLVNDCRIRVSLARHQPLLDSTKGGTPWAGLAADRGEKGSGMKDERSLVSYDNDLF